MRLAWWRPGKQSDSGRPAPPPAERFGSPAEAGNASREVLEHLEDAVLLLEGGIVRWLNPAAIRMFPGLELATGRSLLEVVRDHRIDALAVKAQQLGLEAAAEVELPVSRRALYIRALPLKTGGLIVLARDMTRFRQLETVRQQFVANLAHDMRTPLAGLDLAAQTLADQLPPDGEARVFLDRVIHESERLQAMVANLSQLAALDSEGVQVERAVFDVAGLLDELVARNQPRAARQGLALRADLRPGELRAWGDRQKADQAIQNIVDNALKFTPAGEVVLTGRDDDTRIEIAVRDTGSGIPAAELPRIFERFYKVDRSRSGRSGSGLGLSIARHLIELQGGTITAQSTPNVGTEVVVRLPRPALTSP